jgi:sugar/nucleoside kinase (ribokinase family)
MSVPSTSETRSIDVVCLGAAVVDLINVEPSTALDRVELFRRVAGGAPVNVAATMARLGRRAAVVTRLGDDTFGRFLRAELRRCDVLDDWLQIDPRERTTLVFHARAAGQDDFLVVRGADRELRLDSATRALIQQARIFHTSTFAFTVEPGRSAAVEAIELAAGAGCIVSLDPNYRARNWTSSDAFLPLMRHLLPLTTVIKPSLADAEAIWGPGLTPGDYIEQFHAYGAKQVLLTLGRDGVVVSDGTRVSRIPVIPIDVVDSSGVGDAFTAAASTALLDGHDLVTAARIATLMASFRLRLPDLAAPLPAWRVIVEQARSYEESTASMLLSPRPPRLSE